MTPKTLYQKLVDSHTVARLDDDNVLLYCDLHLMNEYTSPQAFAGLHEQDRGVLVPGQNVSVVSHIIPTHPTAIRVIADPASALQATNLRANCERHAIPLFDTNDTLQGIEHVIAPEHGMIRPGMVVICGDSHTTTYGALGALGFGIGTSEVEHVLATQTLVYRMARTMRIRVDGKLPAGTTAKDLILRIIGAIGAQGARGYVVEYCGSAIRDLSIEARFTLCNMTVEAAARGALIAPDAVATDYVLRRAVDIEGPQRDAALSYWATLQSDADAVFDMDFVFDASEIEPYVTWGTSPDQVLPVSGQIPFPEDQLDEAEQRSVERALAYTHLQPGAALAGTPIQHVFIGSCTNGRIEDLRAVASVVRGRKVAAGVRAMVVPGSGAVKAQAEREGLAEVLTAAGFEWRQPGCSMCLAMNDDVLADGVRCASTTNRNFEGRQGRGAITHLMSPAMAAAAAVTGVITDVRKLEITHA
ncbi:Homoaconitase/3-isopropylmalate dehydratase large subunit [Cupriavidus necator]|uniref:3-isopropylmalate dehydratase large subunit n=1 Tax=Cupriavidus necator (strain ATCC 17699 / DSM 428 / KCTC 22496 / NCIMB 10442 / H16 / Stanier 337) TaxID=381666 RepID=Q0JYW7_CUPNH|nr:MULTISPECIES: 3-isopropylmalate dehydratase large subunit [Cupriavidus]EON19713.1 isopropylmalate isomerase large subunit [Cupriavidus sp. GA3-3]QCC04836.1 3-isopropylmalate dehydratase large subunit [Cupriavidus necator H16]QQB79527.1 3-isopropylmalate dehydratase large subunit [Cupriavidus necator]WKA43764.1 3-isopropylmalate dehydratase large subunit [Cupriavidus necator]CAJ97057.1 3-Isopropylmalate dehydratase large subunit [Cupriavidus necator H16]